MPAGGTVLISTRNTSVDDAYSREHPAVPPGQYVVLEVSDTRSGRERSGGQNLTNPFEFFTTGRSTGQGLSIFSIVRQHGGFVWAATELGRGGTCRLFLPQIEILMPTDSEAAQAAGLCQGSETVLLVEGEELLRSVTSRTLSQCGYQVIDAPDGTRALELLAASISRVALTVADVVLPDMHGVALLERISAVSPETRFLLMTGNPPFAGVLSGQPRGTGIIQKPFTPEALSQRIRAILDMS
jgi:two-component system cell cycle sensor histidine kinase/response regulator CckA